MLTRCNLDCLLPFIDFRKAYKINSEAEFVGQRLEQVGLLTDRYAIHWVVVFVCYWNGAVQILTIGRSVDYGTLCGERFLRLCKPSSSFRVKVEPIMAACWAHLGNGCSLGAGIVAFWKIRLAMEQLCWLPVAMIATSLADGLKALAMLLV